MGSLVNSSHLQTCTSWYSSLLCPPPWLLAPLPQGMATPPPMPQRNSPLSPTPTSTVWPMTTPRLTSRRPRPRMPTVLLLDLSPSLFPTVVSRPPPTMPTMSTVSSPRGPTREPLSTPQSPREGTATPPPPPQLLPQPTTPK